MPIQLYNTLTRTKEPFVPFNEKKVGLYTCGPTVYHYAHIGNLRSYIFEDVLKRVLLWNKFKIKHVMNITDVGHLTSDADTGEDKMLLGAKREHKSVWEIADFYTKAFQDDLKKLNILSPNIWCKATDHIKEQIALIKILEKKGFTYIAGGNVYFDTSKLSDYGKLAQLNLKAEAKARVEKDSNKKNPHDFVLWFMKSKFQEQEMKWLSPWGKEGYPGWHIECSAMSMKYLGKQFDIHCGGIDHIPVHHTNEIAQSEAAIGKKSWVKYWMHNEFLVLAEGKRMGKSEGNMLTLSTLQEQGFHPFDYRYFCLGTSYRMPLMFSLEALEGAKNARKRLLEKVLELKKNKKNEPTNEDLVEEYLNQFTGQVSDDLNTSQALATLWKMLKDEGLNGKEKYQLLMKFDAVLGLDLKKVKEEKVPKEIMLLAEERLKARQAKDWKKSDELRQKIAALGYSVGDTKEGFEVRKV